MTGESCGAGRLTSDIFQLAARFYFRSPQFGNSIGGGSFAGGLTAVGYGREKGNTQLAIVEETGLVGLIVVFPLLGHATWHAYKAMR